MKKTIQTWILNLAGWVFVLLGVIGAFLPLMPTTVFLIIALFLFAKSSPRFHRMLLENRWFGPSLRQWEQQKTVTRQTKYKATTAILITFTLSIAILYQRPYLQLMLVVIAGLLLTYIWRLRETSVETTDN
jgi:uncharacterized membrane protein YbaN (DUF454 family)